MASFSASIVDLDGFCICDGDGIEGIGNRNHNFDTTLVNIVDYRISVRGFPILF